MSDISASVDPSSIIGWYEKIHELLRDFRPEARSMEVNFAQRLTRMHVQIVVPDGMRRSATKVKIPAYPGYRITGMIDEAFIEHNHLWRHDGGHYVLKASDLPASNRYRVTMEGSIDERVLRELVYVKPATNQDDDEKNDRYWLESSLRNPELLQQTYADLEISEVSSGVVVNIDRMFGLAIPPEIEATANAAKRVLDASKNFDRNEIMRAAQTYKKASRAAPVVAIDDFNKIVGRVTGRETVLKHMQVDPQYDIGRVDQPVKYSGIIPQELGVQALTRLSLDEPRARGYLTFKRQEYVDMLSSEFGKLAKKFKTGLSQHRS